MNNVVTLMKVGLVDVARAARVSPSTVSRVLTGRKGFMSEETRQRVLATIQELGYVPNAHASSLRSNKSNTLGLVITNIMNPFFTAVVRGAQDYSAAKGYELFICNTDDDPDYELHYLRTLMSRKVDGLIVTICRPDMKLYRSLAGEGQPLVLIDRALKSLRSDMVTVNNSEIASEVVGKLLANGHSRIGLISPMLGSIQPRRDRVDGSISALAESGIAWDPALLVETKSEVEAGAEAAVQLLSLPDPPTAFFVLNTFQAMGALQAIQSRGLRIPKDVSFVMFDDQEWTELVRPRISAVRQPAYEIGKRAAGLVFERLENPAKAFESVLLSAEFVERDSIGPAPKGPRLV